MSAMNWKILKMPFPILYQRSNLKESRNRIGSTLEIENVCKEQ